MCIRNQSVHQSLVGQTFLREGTHLICLAAHENAILVLQTAADQTPLNYIVCHYPQFDQNGTLIWGAGDYFTILNYQHMGRSNPMAAALAAAMSRLIEGSTLIFQFDQLEEEGDAATLLVKVHQHLSIEEIGELEDCIQSYVDHVSSFTYEECIQDVMRSYSQYSYEVLKPDHTFHI